MPLRAVQIPDATAIHLISPETLQAAPLRQGYRYWKELCGARRFPARADVKPRDIAPLLRNISLVKRQDDDFVYRIVGDNVVRAYDITMQNRAIRDLAKEEPGFAAIIGPLLLKCANSGEAIAVRGHTGRDVFRVTFTDYENVLLPLGPSDDVVDHILVVSQYTAKT